MNITYTIAQLEHNVADGGVIVAHWRVNAEDEGYTASTYGSEGFTPDPESPDYVPFADITEDMVIGWLKSAWGDEKVAEMEANLASQIEAQKEPVTVTGMPWN